MAWPCRIQTWVEMEVSLREACGRGGYQDTIANKMRKTTTHSLDKNPWAENTKTPKEKTNHVPSAKWCLQSFCVYMWKCYINEPTSTQQILRTEIQF